MVFESFLKEIEKIPKKNIVSLYFGGGSPCLLEERYLMEILKKFPKNIEITIEINPQEVTKKKIEALKKMGINRISLGIQTLENSLLKILQRPYTKKKALQSIEDILTSIKNVSCDLMYDIPHQKFSHFKNTLKEISQFPIKHISLYNLTFEKGTPFYKSNLKKYVKNSLRCFKKAMCFLKEKGFDHYEISAFAKPGYRSFHNIGYWTQREYLGIGPSACSYIQKRRFQNIPNVYKYHQMIKKNLSPISYMEKLPYPQNIKESFILNLRMLEGVFIKDFTKIPKNMQKTIDQLIKEEFLIKKEKTIKLSSKGIFFYDEIATRII